MKFKVKASGMPNTGLHSAKVHSVEETTSTGDYKTPQLKVVFVPTNSEEKWIITRWYNLRGYQHDEHGSVKMKNNLPVESVEHTEICFDILGRHAYRMGLEIGDVDASAMIGCTCGIQVEPKDGDPSKVEVSGVISNEKLAELTA